MDRQATIGFVLIAVVLMFWMWFNTPPPPTQKPGHTDTTHIATRESTKTRISQPPQAASQTSAPSEGFGEFFSSRAKGLEKILVINTDLYTAEITTKGGLIRKWELKNYRTWNQLPVQLVDLEKGGDFSLLFLSKDGKQINTKNLYFDASFSAGRMVTLKNDETFSVDLLLPIRDGKKIIKRLTFTNKKYVFDAEVIFQNVADVVSGFEYQVIWENGLPYAEHNSIDESTFAKAFAFSGGELAEADAVNESEPIQSDINGSTDWVAARNKYFAVSLLPAQGARQGTFIEGKRKA